MWSGLCWKLKGAQVTEEGTQVNWPEEEDYLQVVAGGYLNTEEPRVLVFPNILV